jgi:V-type H+-transporting ATPase subunit A
MNVGLRPRLKARPSLHDLVHNRNIDQLSVQPFRSFVEELPAELPPLPLSPDKNPPTPPTPVLSIYPEPAEEPAKMAPKKEVARDADGEEQYGMSQYPPAVQTQANGSYAGSIYSVSGYAMLLCRLIPRC